jgi:hypothetical protein
MGSLVPAAVEFMDRHQNVVKASDKIRPGVRFCRRAGARQLRRDGHACGDLQWCRCQPAKSIESATVCVAAT